MPTLDEPLSVAAMSPSNELNSNATVQSSSTTTQGQPCQSQQSAELAKCREFIRITCGCTKANGKPCSTLFTEEHYIDLRAQAAFLTHEQLDLVILGSIMATVSTDEFRPSYCRHKPAKRQKTTTTYMHHGHHLCKATYNFLHGVGSHRVKAVRQSYLQNGLSTRSHGNAKIIPHNALSFTQITNLVKFIQNYSEQHAILLPGRIPGYKRDDLKLLPCSDSKKVAYYHNEKLILKTTIYAYRKYGCTTRIVAREGMQLIWGYEQLPTEHSVGIGQSCSLILWYLSPEVTSVGRAIRIVHLL